MRKINVRPGLRIFLGLIFLASGISKLTADYQNFLVIVQNYKLFSPFIEDLIARIVPWAEFVFGLTLLIGYWTRISLWASLGMAIGFFVFTSSAIIRGIDIADCGCFGEFIHLPVQYVVIIDLLMITISAFLLTNVEKTSLFGLDSDGPKK